MRVLARIASSKGIGLVQEPAPGELDGPCDDSVASSNFRALLSYVLNVSSSSQLGLAPCLSIHFAKHRFMKSTSTELPQMLLTFFYIDALGAAVQVAGQVGAHLQDSGDGNAGAVGRQYRVQPN